MGKRAFTKGWRALPRLPGDGPEPVAPGGMVVRALRPAVLEAPAPAPLLGQGSPAAPLLQGVPEGLTSWQGRVPPGVALWLVSRAAGCWGSVWVLCTPHPTPHGLRCQDGHEEP